MLKFCINYKLIIILSLLSIFLSNSNITNNEDVNVQSTYKIGDLTELSYNPHSTVYIADDDMLSSAAVSGEGTSSEPYLLEGWSITTDGSSHGMYIQGTTKYFTIQNCWIECTPAGSLTGINIISAAENTVKIINNVVVGFNYGISLDTSNNVTIEDNICNYNYERAIATYACSNCFVTNNTCQFNGNEFNGYGIFIRQSSNIIITENKLLNNTYHGVFLYSTASNCKIYNNIFMNTSGGSGSSGNDDGTGNIWYDSDNNKGNFWDNWVGTGSYSIDGSAGTFDLYPLVEPSIDEFLFPSFSLFAIGFVIVLLFYSKKRN